MSEKIARGIQETAEAAGLSPKTIRNKVQAGELRHTRINSRILILDSDLRAWLGRHVQETWQRANQGRKPKGEVA